MNLWQEVVKVIDSRSNESLQAHYIFTSHELPSRLHKGE
jgi:hypothetical protein